VELQKAGTALSRATESQSAMLMQLYIQQK